MSLFDEVLMQRYTAQYERGVRLDYMVSLLRYRWPNVILKFYTDECTHNTIVGVIIDGQMHKIVTIQRFDTGSDEEIYSIIVKYLNDLKKVKRKLAMEHILQVGDTS